MGATRRLDHYDASMGWQGLFVVAGIGVLVLGLGVLCQIAQLVVSIRQRNQNRDTTGDPWGGRTLEWATPSPAPIYNFAQVPEVTSRDAFWMMKERQRGASAPRKSFSPITIPNNSSLGVAIGMLSFLIGFGLIWHIFWLACVGIVGIIIVILIRTTGDEDETELSAVEVERIDAAARHETRKKRA